MTETPKTKPPFIITTPGIYDIPSSRYHEDPVIEPSLSNTIAKYLINQSPLHAAAHHPRLALNPIREENQKFDLGKAAHTLLLRDGMKFEIVKESSWSTKAAKEARAKARKEGLIPILENQFDRVDEMVKACRDQLADHELGDVMAKGYGERTLAWKEDDVWCRCLIDWLPDKVEEGCIIVDYKTTSASAHPATWGFKTGPAIGFTLQNAFYQRGIRRILGIKDYRFLFLVQENYPPYCISVVEVSKEALAEAMDHVKSAVGIWRHCLTRNDWPGYPPRVIPVSPAVRVATDPYELLTEDVA